MTGITKKTCSECKEKKPKSEFNKLVRSKDGLDYRCKVCRHNYYTDNKAKVLARSKTWVLKNPEKRKENLKRFHLERRIKWHSIISKSRPLVCAECGYDKCIPALEFHHINPEEKLKNISWYWNRAPNVKWITQCLKELDKCVILCANCHRELHWGGCLND